MAQILILISIKLDFLVNFRLLQMVAWQELAGLIHYYPSVFLFHWFITIMKKIIKTCITIPLVKAMLYPTKVAFTSVSGLCFTKDGP